jgi:hypothetical protein
MTEQREEHVYLGSRKDGADKDYNLHLEREAGTSRLWHLAYENGKHGAALKRKEKIEGAVPYDVAKKAFDQTLKEKMSAKGGYVTQGVGVEYQSTVLADRVSGLAPQLLKTIPEALVYERMANPSYLWQEKKDGERRMIRKGTEGAGPDAVVTVVGTNRVGLIVPIPKELADAVAALPLPFCVLDGEDMGQGRYAAFDLVATEADPNTDSAAARPAGWRCSSSCAQCHRRTGSPSRSRPCPRRRASWTGKCARAAAKAWSASSSPRPTRQASARTSSNIHTWTARPCTWPATTARSATCTSRCWALTARQFR